MPDGTTAPVNPPGPPTPLVPDPRAQFVALSAALTGFDAATLHGTGMVATYYDTLAGIVGERILARLLGAWGRVATMAGGDAASLDTGIQVAILADPTFGPLARNLMALWYMGQWNQLPADWRNANGANARDTDHIVSSEAYVQGLIWPAVHSHPQGAKQPGYGSWSLPPDGQEAP
jgi:hypothetical protein